jgi:hypothetical protein
MASERVPLLALAGAAAATGAVLVGFAWSGRPIARP